MQIEKITIFGGYDKEGKKGNFEKVDILAYLKRNVVE